MVDLPAPYRVARAADAAAMAELANMAGEGLPLYLWTEIASPGQSGWDVGRERARRESGAFSYRNTVVREEHGSVVAALVGYPLDDSPEPVEYAAMPPIVVPLQQLEDRVPGTWYVNVLATYPAFRGRGYGKELLSIAERLARATGKRGLSIVVADANVTARKLYERFGFREQDTRPMVKDGWQHPGSHWVLLLKAL